MFDFLHCLIVGQTYLKLPDLDMIHEPYLSISASSQLQATQFYSSGIAMGSEFCQNFQISISFKHQNRVKMMEFCIKWNEIKGKMDRATEILHIATKELIFDRKLQINEDLILLPTFDHHNKIKGTQLVECANNPFIFIFEND